MKKLILLGLILCLASFTTANAAQIIFDLDPDDPIELGQEFTMNIFSDGWSDADGLVGGTVFVEFDDDILEFKAAAVTEPDFGGGRLYWDTRATSDVDNTIRLGFSNIGLPLVTEDFSVGTITFLALTAGTSPIQITTENFRKSGETIDFDGSVGSVSVVPIPSAILLLGGGLLGLIAVRRRRS